MKYKVPRFLAFYEYQTEAEIECRLLEEPLDVIWELMMTQLSMMPIDVAMKIIAI